MRWGQRRVSEEAWVLLGSQELPVWVTQGVRASVWACHGTSGAAPSEILFFLNTCLCIFLAVLSQLQHLGSVLYHVGLLLQWAGSGVHGLSSHGAQA